MSTTGEVVWQKCSDSWYSVDVDRLNSPELASRFVQMSCDAETDSFLANCEKLSNSLGLQLWHLLCIPVLRIFYKQTCINALLDRGAMFLFSSAQLGSLLGFSDKDVSSSCSLNRTVLDLGAGDGHISLRYSHFFDRVLATEASAFMRYRLKEKGITVIGMDEWQVDTLHVDMISCLNLLDRHPRPRTLLRQLRQKCISSNCHLLVSVVLPWEQYVEYNDSGSTLAEETVSIFGETFEDQLKNVIVQLFSPAGFHVERFTRLPYLCEGDMRFNFYMLSSAVLLLKVA
ncbi:methyltransferase protein 9 [Trichuris trichiura]|uniref:Methyltransferase protein 9 n=1 Tax=Trichuris trichiura TaxID=36087 RepID=A0A077YXS9_TRITR|nr:methyltransferase protein 9 [Trichuris trichiura]